MKKTISENELKNIIKEASESVLSEAAMNRYTLNNLTWARADGTDNNTSRLTPEAIEVRKYLISNYPSLKSVSGFGDTAGGYDINAVFNMMKEDILNGRTRPESQKIADGEETNKLFSDLSGAKVVKLTNGHKVLKLKNGVYIYNNGRFVFNKKIGNVPQDIKPKIDEIMKQQNLLNEVTWGNASLGTAENLNDPKFKKLAQDFGMLLDVSIRRSGMFRNWGSDHSLDEEAKIRICNLLNINYIPSKYSGSSDGYNSDEGGKSNEPQQPGKNQTNPNPATKKSQPDQRIKRLQQMLNNGLWAYPKLAEDGLLGPKTKAVAASAGVNPATWNYTPIPQNPAFVGDAAGRFATAPQAQQAAPVAQQAVNTTQVAQSAPVAQQAIATAPVNAADRLQSIKAPMAESNDRLKQIIKEEVLNALKGMK